MCVYSYPNLTPLIEIKTLIDERDNLQNTAKLTKLKRQMKNLSGTYAICQ